MLARTVARAQQRPRQEVQEKEQSVIPAATRQLLLLLLLLVVMVVVVVAVLLVMLLLLLTLLLPTPAMRDSRITLLEDDPEIRVRFVRPVSLSPTKSRLWKSIRILVVSLSFQSFSSLSFTLKVNVVDDDDSFLFFEAITLILFSLKTIAGRLSIFVSVR